jgi:hypothetical protein
VIGPLLKKKRRSNILNAPQIEAFTTNTTLLKCFLLIHPHTIQAHTFIQRI